MRDVAQRVDALHVAAAYRQVGVVGLDRALVGQHRVLPAPDPGVDVRGHVHQVAGSGHQSTQAVGRLDAALRVGRGLDRMHVQVQRTGMVGVARHHRFQGGDDLGGMALRAQLLVVVRPGLQVHQRLGVQHGRIQVVRALPDQARGGPGIGLVQCRTIFGGRLRVARRQRRDEGLLACAGRRCQFLRTLQAAPGVGMVGRVHAGIDMRPQHQRCAPPAHRALRVEFGGLEEGAFGRVVVEAPGQRQALVEPALHLRVAAGDRETVITQAIQQHRAGHRQFRGRSGRRVGRRRCLRPATAAGQGQQQRGGSQGPGKSGSHAAPPRSIPIR